MQLQLPLFPQTTKLISKCLGVYEREGIVQYIVNGLPSYSHGINNHRAFRFITSNYIREGLCSKKEVERCFGVSESSVQRWYNLFISEGESGIFGNDGRKGVPHKLLGDRSIRIQAKLDKGQSVNSIAKEEGINEGTIRYSIRQGYLKKSEVGQFVAGSDNTQ